MAESTAMAREPTVRQQRLRAEMVREAMALFRSQGYEATSVSQIVDMVGISPRSFFRYFQTKDDLVFSWLEGQGDVIEARLLAGVGPPMTVLAAALLDIAAMRDADTEDSRGLVRMIFGTPALGGRLYAHNLAWESRYLRALSARQTDAEARAVLQYEIAAMSAVFLAALQVWAGDVSMSFAARLRAAFAALQNITVW